MKLKSCVAILIALAVTQTAISQESHAATSRSKLIEDRLIISEVGASMTIPKKWLTWSQYFSLDSTHLRGVQNAKLGEWDSAWAPVTDATLPFAECLLQVGDGIWGEEGSGISSHLRVYLTETKPEEITKAVATKSVEAAIKAKGQSVASNSKDENGWRISHVGFDLSYGDYGGRAGVYFYSRICGKKTLTLVFMLVDHLPEVVKQKDAIISSFRMEN